MKTIFLILTLCVFSSCVPIPAFGNSEMPAGKQEKQMAGFATWYSVESCRKERWGKLQPMMANGKPLMDTAMTCALPWKPDGQKYLVTNLLTQKQVVLMHTDRGPAAWTKNLIDLTPMAFLALGGKLEDGKLNVRVERVK